MKLQPLEQAVALEQAVDLEQDCRRPEKSESAGQFRY